MVAVDQAAGLEAAGSVALAVKAGSGVAGSAAVAGLLEAEMSLQSLHL